MNNSVQDRRLPEQRLDDAPMEQLFGDSPYSYKNGLVEMRKQSLEEKIDQHVDKIPGGKKVYVAMMGVLGLTLIILIAKVNFFGMLTSALILGFAIYMYRKSRSESTESDLTLHVSNVAVTTKGLLSNVPWTSRILEYGRELLYVGSALVALSLFWNVLFAFGFYGVVIGTLVCFANKETKTLYRGLCLFVWVEMLLTILYSLLHNDINAFGAVSMIIAWSLAHRVIQSE